MTHSLMQISGMILNIALTQKPTLVRSSVSSFKRVQPQNSPRVSDGYKSYINSRTPQKGYMYPRFLLRKNQILRPLSASVLLEKQTSYNSNQTHFRFSQVLPISFFSLPTNTGFSRPVFCNLQSIRAMASQSQSASVHDFTVKVSFLILGGYGFPQMTLEILFLFLWYSF